MCSLYDVLGVDRNATATQIGDAFRRAAVRLHPDHGGDREAFQAVRQAYEVLSDDVRRKRYDETGETDQASEPDEVQAAVMAMVGAAFCQDQVDPIDWMTKQIDAERSQACGRRDSVNKSIRQMERNVERFRSRDASKNPAGKAMILEAAEANLQTARQGLQRCLAEIAFATKKLEALNGLADSSDRSRRGWPCDMSTAGMVEFLVR